jgi:hypothetical protein
LLPPEVPTYFPQVEFILHRVFLHTVTSVTHTHPIERPGHTAEHWLLIQISFPEKKTQLEVWSSGTTLEALPLPIRAQPDRPAFPVPLSAQPPAWIPEL